MARAGDPVSVRLQIEIHEIHKFVWVCDQLATFFGSKTGRRQVRAISTSFELVRDLVCHWIA